MAQAITSFQGKYKFLSNFWPVQIFFKGIIYPTLEHAFQAQKTMSGYLQMQIAACKTPGDAKRMARQFQLREDWHDIKLRIMLVLLRRKFDVDDYPDLAEALLGTYPVCLIEGNNWGDVFYGQSPIGVGENYLGRLLMQVRLEIKETMEEMK